MAIQGTQKNLVVYAEFPTAIDVSNISQVNFDLQIQTPGLNGLIQCLLRPAPGSGTLAQVMVSGTYPNDGYDSNRKTLTVDTSSISGLAYVCVHFEANFSSSSYARLDVFNITGEV